MSPAMRKVNLTAHVVSSVGWLGSVAAFLALSIVGVRSTDPLTVRACYVAMNLIGQWSIVPLSALSLLTGVVQSLGTPWGLVRYYWVLTKFALTVGATLLLLLHQFTAVAGAARRMTIAVLPPSLAPSAGALGAQLIFDAGLALAVLVLTTVLSIYKPWGKTGYAFGSDMASASPSGNVNPIVRAPLGVRVLYSILGLLLATVVILHLMGKGMAHHAM